MRTFSLRIAALTIIFSCLTIGARLIGKSQQTEALAMLQSADCSQQPCWHGVRPGQTSLDQAIHVIQRERVFDPQSWLNLDNERCWKTQQPPIWDVCAFANMSQSNSAIQRLFLTPPSSSITIGDLILLLGQPAGLRVSPDGGGYQGDGSFNYTVFFANNLSAVVHTRQRHLSPDMPAISVAIMGDQSVLPLQPWHGFGRKVNLPRYEDTLHLQP